MQATTDAVQPMTTKDCDEFGLAPGQAEFSSVRVDRLGPNGWFTTFDLEPSDTPGLRSDLKWTRPGDLEIVVDSPVPSGSVEYRLGDFWFVRTYRRNRGGA
jgi:hypothetical protein